ncbi:MAG TPA: TonB-dependent receptor plug domain-containing protein, partial [Aliidongia sp.]|uniref:TonB-dependent receptor plug domain-containing protein n=1 Tax=Aliidongia sp. TaxID=1914230 RepID=UPI002DDCEE53
MALLIASAPIAALAQTAPTDPSTPPVAGTKPAAPATEEIVVTAQKREEKLKDVPASVTALSGDKLQSLGVQDLDHLSVYVPGLSEQTTRPGQSGVTLRGITTGNAGSGVTV